MGTKTKQDDIGTGLRKGGVNTSPPEGGTIPPAPPPMTTGRPPDPKPNCRSLYEPVLSDEVTPQERLAGLFGKTATDLELDLDAIAKATPGPWQVGFGYEQSDPGCFVVGGGRIVAAEQDGTDCVLRREDAAFMVRTRERFPILVNAAVELNLGFAELIRRYREWAGMKTCTPAARELLRRVSDDIEEQLSGAEQMKAEAAKLCEERDGLAITRDESMEIIGELKARVEFLENEQQVLINTAEEARKDSIRRKERARAATQFIVDELGSIGPENVDQAASRATVALKARRERAETLEKQNTELRAKLQKEIVLVWRCPNCEAPCEIEDGRWFCSGECGDSGPMPPEVIDARKEDGDE